MALRRPPATARPSTPRLLLVSDDAEGAEVLTRVLGAAGFLVERYEHHDEGIRRLAQEPFSAAIAAFNAISSNLKFLESVRNNPDESLQRTKVLFVASNAKNELFSWQSGVDAFLAKPVHLDEVVTTVKELLARPEEQRRIVRRDAVRRISE